MKILCVAEKPSIAKSLADILASDGFTSRPGKDKYCRNFDLSYRWQDAGWANMTITSVRGHLTENDFTERHRKWHSCDPLALFEAPLETRLSKDGELIALNLRKEARSAQILMIWTDCDREGEHIGAEIVRECQKANPRIDVRRARFSAIIANQIHAACRNAGQLDWAAASAVEARQELDLRVGAALTRMQTMNLKQAIPELSDHLISYGPCQFPTLGFVVDQYERVRSFVPEDFWHILLTLKRRPAPGQPLQTVEFRWKRGHLFDQPTVQLLLDACKRSNEARVTRVTSKPTRKFKPYPLTTVELQKSGSRLLSMAPKRILDLAEALYNKGFLSYPRTETDQYDAQFDFHTLIQKQSSDAQWGQYAQGLLSGGGGGGNDGNDGNGYERPRSGKKNDKAHPPIHPTAHANNLSADERKVYEYVVRRFLASCSRDAMGKQTSVEVEVADEAFSASGLVIHERNYLDVFPYDKWSGTVLPPFTEGETFTPSSCLLKQGSTTAPNLLTEADLVSLMDKNGIGTDATIAEHIAKIIAREYVLTTQAGKVTYLVPSTLGMGLVVGYNRIDFEKSLCKPLLRRETEFRMNLICEGQRTKEETIEESVQEYRQVYLQAKRNFGELVHSVSRHLREEFDEVDGNAAAMIAPPADADDDVGGYNNNDDDDDDDDDYLPPPPPPRAGGGVSARAGRPTTTPAPAAGPSLARPRPRPRHDDDDDDDGGRGGRGAGGACGPPFCRCDAPAVLRTVQKEGANKGRRFWSCSKGPNDGSCGFFDWEGGDAGGAANVSAAVAGPSRSRTAAATSSARRVVGTGVGAGAGRRAPSLDPPPMPRRAQAPAARRGARSQIVAQLDDGVEEVQVEDDFEEVEQLDGPPPVSARSWTAATTAAPTVGSSLRPGTGAGSGSRGVHTHTSAAGAAGMHSSATGAPPGPTREEIEARREAIALIDELAASSSQESDSGGGANAGAARIEEYRAWFASLATDDGPSGGSRGPGPGGKRRCDCSLEAALRTVSKEGANQGRQFYCCPKESALVRCRMFEWADEDAGVADVGAAAGPSRGWTAASIGAGGRGGAGRTGSGPAAGTTVTGTCYKCDREGHWAKDCPGEAAPSRARTGTAATRGSGTRRRAPLASSRSTNANSNTNTNAHARDRDVCFKCGEGGHWASDCPNDGPRVSAWGARGEEEDDGDDDDAGYSYAASAGSRSRAGGRARAPARGKRKVGGSSSMPFTGAGRGRGGGAARGKRRRS